MANARSSDLLRQVRTLFGAGTVTGLSDAELLDRFTSRSAKAAEDTLAAEAAFEALVARHGPMVLGVLRRALADPCDVEDAFQATFLVLVRRAGSVRVGDSLGRWLYGVSRRVAAKARARSQRARSRTMPLEGEPIAPEQSFDQAGLLAVLDDAVSRLPEKYRAPVVLCHLEGLSHAEAAARLRWPVGTVSGRLSRARGLLKDRLVRRGVAPTENSLGVLLAAGGIRADVPVQLGAATARAAVRVSMGTASSAGAASGSALTLTNEVLRAAVAVKLKAAAAVVLAVALAGAGVAGVRDGGRPGRHPEDRASLRQPTVTTVPAAPRSANHRPADEIVKEIEALLKTTRQPVDSREALDRLIQARVRVAGLVDELRTYYPDDPRVARYLPERWEYLTSVNRRADIHAEIAEVLRTAKDPALKKEALLFETCLKFLYEPISGRAAVSLAEAFARHAPGESRAGTVLCLAEAKLQDDGLLRAGLLVILAAAGALTLCTARTRRVGLRRWLKLAARLGGLILALLVVLLLTFQFLSHDRQTATTMYLFERRNALINVLSDYTLRRRAGFIAFSLLHKVPWQLQSIARSGWTGLAVALASATALFLIIGRRRFAGPNIQWASAARLAVLGFAAVLAGSVALDAFLIARRRAALEVQIVREYPGLFHDRLDCGNHWQRECEVRLAAGQRRQREQLGKPFELAFADAITGRPVSMQALRGKVVVVEFWSTYPSLFPGHTAAMKRLYAEYYDKGVEFIGVCHAPNELNGGLDALKAFIAREVIPWPQYYDAPESVRDATRPGATDRLLASAEYYEGFDSNRIVPETAASDFARSWGINSFPTVFLIDAEGKLYSTEARGKLDTLIPRLLANARRSSDHN